TRAVAELAQALLDGLSFGGGRVQPRFEIVDRGLRHRAFFQKGALTRRISRELGLVDLRGAKLRFGGAYLLGTAAGAHQRDVGLGGARLRLASFLRRSLERVVER